MIGMMKVSMVTIVEYRVLDKKWTQSFPDRSFSMQFLKLLTVYSNLTLKNLLLINFVNPITLFHIFKGEFADWEAPHFAMVLYSLTKKEVEIECL